MDRPERALTPPPSSPSTSVSPSSIPSSLSSREPDRRSADEIRADVALERERMDLRLAELRGRREPSAVAAQARAAVTEKAKRRGRAAADAVRKRPVAATLLAAAAGALVGAVAFWRRR